MTGPIPGGGGTILTPSSGRRSRILDVGEGRRAIAIAIVSSVLFFSAIGLVIVNSPGWPRFQASFLDAEVFAASWPRIASAFWVNIRLFLIAEVLILALGLVIAVMRSLPGPVFFPLRLLATAYVDLFRALPGVLVIFMLGFGIPALRIEGVPIDPFFWAVVALTLIYSAYVAEVYRAGIESIHPSQAAAARSLGLSQLQSMRHVVLPQAVRRVVPPLLNDFIGLQKDTALVGFLGVVEVLKAAQIRQSATFNFTPYLVTALLFVLLTIPMARFVDWLVARDQRRAAVGGR
ncbi:MAG TPA: amino acid ABC transporter permease [Candidatus Limnocylindrales bacterium]|jgi:polar amino acid transport system permease protein